MSSQIECSICMECIEFNKNCVTTDCGHSFHTSCLMTNVAHNGFGCPYCRSEMAKKPADDESTEYDSVDEEDDDYALRGLRFFFNNLNGEEHDTDDVNEEEADEEFVNHNAQPEEPDVNIPTIDFVAQKLREQGVTFEKLVHMICNLDHEEYSEDEVAERFNDELFGKIRIIVSNYQPEQVIPAQVIINEQHHVAGVTPQIPSEAILVSATPR